MPNEIVRTPVEFQSRDLKSKCQGYIWWTEDILAEGAEPAAPKGVVQLVHGMAEHIERYDEFARFLVEQGYLVAGHNHIGHGSSAPKEQWGVMDPEKAPEALIGDVGTLRSLVQLHIAEGTPYFIFGHSMGSFITRCYIGRAGAGLAGAVICGTGFVAPAVGRFGFGLSKFLARTKGADYVSKLLYSMSLGPYEAAIENPRTPLDWLSYNEENVDAYAADEQSGFPFAAGGYVGLMGVTAEACSASSAKKVPKDLPLLFIAGDADPVGSSGVGVLKAAELYEKAGVADVTCVIYEHMRHEILNETERAGVMNDVAAWLNKHVKE